MKSWQYYRIYRMSIKNVLYTALLWKIYFLRFQSNFLLYKLVYLDLNDIGS